MATLNPIDTGARRTGAGQRAQLIVGDVREQVAGEFAGRIGPDAPVGTFANVLLEHRRGRGTYAGDSDRQREGSFGDVDVTDE